jgi:hypothetical protein
MMTTLNGASPIAPNYTAPNNFQTDNIAPTGLDRFSTGGLDNLLNSLSPLSRITNQPDVLAMQPGTGQRAEPRVNITVQAPVQNVLGVIDNSRNIEINVRPLRSDELGSLNTARQNIPQLLQDASARINRDNLDFHGKTTADLRRQARSEGYYESPAHMAWSQAAEARTGGRVPASWWRENDPYGGTAGNGPLIEPGGIYPGVTSRIAMGHDTDWTLGRQFGAGPLRDLNTMGNGTSKQEFKDRGMFGLWPANDNRFNSAAASSYSTPLGHPDWNVSYTNPW